MDSEKKKSDEYWMGVRDALRMVDSFIKWARRNKDRAKSLDDFIHDGLVAAAKRCETCLKDDLGLSFAEAEKESDSSREIEKIPPGYEVTTSQEDSSLTEALDNEFEITPEDMSPHDSEVPIESEDDSISIDTVGRLEDEEIEDLSLDRPPREFSTDFELIEPTDLEMDRTDSKDEEYSTVEPEISEESREETDQKPSFTWDDYEKAVTPTGEELDYVDQEEDDDIELPPPAEIDTAEESSESISVPKPPDLPVDDLEDSSLDEEDVDSNESSEAIRQPPPPPPPESDEDEEERRRRARRLFFGD